MLLGRTGRLSPLVGAHAADVAILAVSYLIPDAHALLGELRHRATPTVFLGEKPSPLHRGLKRVVRDRVAGQLLRRCQGLVGVTRDTVAWYREHYQLALPATWMPYHRDLRAFMAGERAKTTSGGPLRVLALGSLVPWKGMEHAIQAAALAGADQVSLSVVGEGPLRGSLERLARRLGVSVRFPGPVRFQDVPATLGAHDVLVAPSLNDGFGMVVVEALAAGAPVIASDEVMSAREYVRDWQNGVLVAVGDVHGLARAMTALAGDRALLDQMSAEARRGIAAAYDPVADGARLATFLGQVAGGR